MPMMRVEDWNRRACSHPMLKLGEPVRGEGKQKLPRIKSRGLRNWTGKPSEATTFLCSLS